MQPNPPLEIHLNPSEREEAANELGMVQINSELVQDNSLGAVNAHNKAIIATAEAIESVMIRMKEEIVNYDGPVMEKAAILERMEGLADKVGKLNRQPKRVKQEQPRQPALPDSPVRPIKSFPIDV